MNIIASDAVIASENLGHIAIAHTEIGIYHAPSVLGRGHDRHIVAAKKIQTGAAHVENQSKIVTVVQEGIEVVTTVLEDQCLRRGDEMPTDDDPTPAQAGLARRDLARVRRVNLDTTANLRAPKNAENRLSTPATITIAHGSHR